MRHCLAALTLLLASLLASPAQADNVLLLVEQVPADGLVVAHVDLTPAVRACQIANVAADGVYASATDGKRVPLQLVPDADFDPQSRIAGTLVMRLPQGSDGRLQLRFTSGRQTKGKPWDGQVTTPKFTLRHDPKRQGGFPTKITFTDTGKVFDSMAWRDRVHHREQGGYNLGADQEAKVEQVAQGPLCTAVRVRARYVQAKDKTHASQPTAVYDWIYLADRPLVLVRASMTQREPFSWSEIHFLELDYPREAFPRYVGGEPIERGEFTGSKKSYHFPQWGAILDGPNAIAMLQCGQVLLYDGGPGTYLQAHGDAAWQGWNQTEREASAWLWMASEKEPVSAIQAAVAQVSSRARVTITTEAVHTKIEASRKEPRAQQTWWRSSLASQLEVQGRLDEATQTADGQLPSGWTAVTAGELGLIVQRAVEGVRLVNLADLVTDRQLLAPKVLPLFALTLRNAETKESVQLQADQGWRQCEVTPTGQSLTIQWQQPTDARLGSLKVTAQAAIDAAASALRWQLKVDGAAAPWSVWQVVFPQVAVADLGPGASVFYPQAAGHVQQGAWQKAFRFGGTYPGGWTSMQYMAAYDKDRKTGLYVAAHDPWGSTKEIRVQGRPADQAVTLAIENPAVDMGVPGNRFELSGQVVWQLLRGDWFDASVIYRDWVRKEARWYPKLGPNGREDTPAWMRELSAWAQTGGAPRECAESVKQFADFLGVPVGFHWYSWHQIPFDNDYPHYFPTKDGFADAVRDLQAHNVFVMPYINGRLWDIHDKGKDDFEFSKVAQPAATKDDQGKPYLESYSSKESDGSKVELAAMCPTTRLWQDKQREIVLRLFNECGVKAVYMDQVAAAKPQLCMDRTHGHPLGGGHWWTEGYWQLVNGIRQAMPKDRMLTTECNAEPYTQVFDGYLTWHWQYDGQVPAFAAVYGGAVQMFGRAYRGGETKDLALRMKAGQQLVFGEQIGWLAPSVIKEKDNGAFLREVIRLRHALRRYFYAGEMARPPELAGEVPTVTADWQWHNRWPVTTSAVLTGAWQQPHEGRLVLLFVNVSDQPLTAQYAFDAARYGLAKKDVRVTRLTADGPGETFRAPATFQRELTFPAKTAWAWEITTP